MESLSSKPFRTLSTDEEGVSGRILRELSLTERNVGSGVRSIRSVNYDGPVGRNKCLHL